MIIWQLVCSPRCPRPAEQGHRGEHTSYLLSILAMNIFKQFQQLFQTEPSPEAVAKQLRQPSGLLARRVGNKMNETNAPLYDFALREMNLADGDQLLEIGFGNGNFFKTLFAAANNLRISGLDFSKDMVQAALENNEARIKSGDLSLSLGSSDGMLFADATFDKIFCINVIYFWETAAEHLKEIQRVLKPGGRFYAIIRSKETLQMMPFTQFGFKLYEVEEWCNILQENGFSNLRVATKSESPFEYQGKQFQLASICISSELAAKP